jgi:uncharacterized protein YfaT (DUF1175 family)
MRRRDLLWAIAAPACKRTSAPTAASYDPPSDLYLPDPTDRRAFLDWFTFLAEALYDRPAAGLPPAVSDCAALLRFCFVEALRRHDQPWARSLGLTRLPSAPPVQRFEYPRTTPNGPRVFQTSSGDWSEFADARTLMLNNCRLRTRRLDEASPGDLLFFEQAHGRLPFHAMIYLGPSRLTADEGPFAVYHTGPNGKDPGEMRRPSIAGLLRHPQPEWRPHPGNRNFLGVHRWNLIHEES